MKLNLTEFLSLDKIQWRSGRKVAMTNCQGGGLGFRQFQVLYFEEHDEI